MPSQGLRIGEPSLARGAKVRPDGVRIVAGKINEYLIIWSNQILMRGINEHLITWSSTCNFKIKAKL